MKAGTQSKICTFLWYEKEAAEAAAFYCSIVTTVRTLLAMKQASCAWWWSSATFSREGGSPPQSTVGRRVTRVIAMRPSAPFSSTPSASSR